MRDGEYGDRHADGFCLDPCYYMVSKRKTRLLTHDRVPCHLAAALCQLDLGPVKMWRTSALLLRAVWDSVPEVRPMYPDFMDRFETLESRRPRYVVMNKGGMIYIYSALPCMMML